MGKSLIIVESPTKIKTLKKFLGDEFIIESSVGHIRDLPEKEFGIDMENDFEPKYETLPDKKDVIKNLIKAAKQCDTVYLSPDPDREGEAIAWHIAEILPPDTNVQRATFNAITKDAVVQALENTREIDYALVNAQQARRMLDRIVGYKISPILNRRVMGGVSAGRVQSVALKLVVDREREILAFIPVEYWNLASLLQCDGEKQSFSAYLYAVDGKKVEKEAVEGKDLMLISNEQTAMDLKKRLETGKYEITKVEKKERRRNPVPPFITSTLQQEASRHHGFSSARTMRAAQGLYEGVDFNGGGPEGLITYMRTDSVRVAPEALTEARLYIKSEYGKDYLPPEAREYTSKKSAQDAHEAIRPASLKYTPEEIEKHLERDQALLYRLIWRRFIASQMMPAIYDTVSADIMTDNALHLRATGSTIKFRGFLAAYEEKDDDKEEDEKKDDKKDGEKKDDKDKRLPELEVGKPINLIEATAEQAFTRPPPRFTEASLVKELERSGIGRPSTYAAIMNKIQSRSYTIKESARLKPTELGTVLCEMLEANFSQIMDVNFTVHMEDDLELIAVNEKDWKGLIRDFWTDFLPTVEKAEEEAFVPKIMTDLECPKCEKKLQKIWARSKYFYGCSGYPDCDYTTTTEALAFNKEDYAPEFDWEQKCPQCEAETTVRHGRYGTFLGCSKYPDCKGIINIPKKGEVIIPQEDMPKCPAIGCDGSLSARKSRFGKTFFSCTNYPDCDVIVNDLDQLADKYPDHPKTAYVKKTKKGAKKTKAKAKKKSTGPKKPRNVKPSDLSPEMAEFLGETELPLTQVIKKTWEHIKANDLQDPKDKRIIIPDEKLAKIFGSSEPIQMFKMTKLLSQHLTKKPESTP